MICLKNYKWNKHIRQNNDKNTNKIPTFSYFKGRKIPTFSYFGLKIPTFSYFFDLSYHFQPWTSPEVQNRSISGPKDRIYVLQKFI